MTDHNDLFTMICIILAELNFNLAWSHWPHVSLQRKMWI